MLINILIVYVDIILESFSLSNIHRVSLKIQNVVLDFRGLPYTASITKNTKCCVRFQGVDLHKESTYTLGLQQSGALLAQNRACRNIQMYFEIFFVNLTIFIGKNKTKPIIFCNKRKLKNLISDVQISCRVHTDLEFFSPSFEDEKYNIFPESDINFLSFSLTKSYIPILQD